MRPVRVALRVLLDLTAMVVASCAHAEGEKMMMVPVVVVMAAVVVMVHVVIMVELAAHVDGVMMMTV